MRGQMLEWPLRVSSIIDHAARFHGRRRVIGRNPDGALVESDWATIRERALKVAEGFRRLGARPGDRIGVMAWNTPRHLELWYGVPGAGAVLHSLNPRLFDDQLVYIINHAEDRWLVADADLAPLVARLAPRLDTVEGVMFLTSADRMPDAAPPGALAYEDWIAEQPADRPWTDGDERDACGLCYTSGTTGDPKGVVYSHRSNLLHAMMAAQPDGIGLSATDMVMPVVPLFHANGWSVGYSAPMTGAAVALPGRDATPEALFDMLERGATCALAVPTVWLPLLRRLEETGERFSTLERVVIGGSACPQAVIEAFQNRYGVRVVHAWGMTECSSIGSMASPTPETEAGGDAARLQAQLSAGRTLYGIDLKVALEDGSEAPWDGRTTGRLKMRGFAVLERYARRDETALDPDGWFDTGDVAAMDANGFIRITDRVKDVIKSGGEWISSIDLENLAVGAPGVAEAAAIGVDHPKWGERPVLLAVRAPGSAVSADEIRAHLACGLAKWQLPDEILFVDEIPHTATGKISKVAIRRRLAEAGYALPDLRAPAGDEAGGV